MVTKRYGKREKVQMTTPLSSASNSSCTTSRLSSSSQTSSMMHSTTPPASPLLVEPHQLTLEEKHHILSVLLKLDDLQNLENIRHRMVREQFGQSLDDLAATITSKVTTDSSYIAAPNKYCCHICTGVIGRHRVKKERTVLMCWDCNQLTCDYCGVSQSTTGPFHNRFESIAKTVRLCKPCMYRREMTLKSGEWFYGAVGVQEVKNIHKSVIESLEIPSSDQNEEAVDNPNWKQKAQKRISRTRHCTLKVMKQKWQRLAKFKPNLTDSRDSMMSISSDEEKSRFSEEIQAQYLAYRGSRAACRYTNSNTNKMNFEESSNSSESSKQWSRESSPERFEHSKDIALSSRSLVSTGVVRDSSNSFRRNRSDESLLSPLSNLSPQRKLKTNHSSMDLARKISKKDYLLQKWRMSAGSCSNIPNIKNIELSKNVLPLSSNSLF